MFVVSNCSDIDLNPDSMYSYNAIRITKKSKSLTRLSDIFLLATVLLSRCCFRLMKQPKLLPFINKFQDFYYAEYNGLINFWLLGPNFWETLYSWFVCLTVAGLLMKPKWLPILVRQFGRPPTCVCVLVCNLCRVLYADCEL